MNWFGLELFAPQPLSRHGQVDVLTNELKVIYGLQPEWLPLPAVQNFVVLLVALTPLLEPKVVSRITAQRRHKIVVSKRVL